MTIKEFYEWAVANNIEDYEVHILYRDGGGYYSGYDVLKDKYIFHDDKVVEI